MLLLVLLEFAVVSMCRSRRIEAFGPQNSDPGSFRVAQYTA